MQAVSTGLRFKHGGTMCRNNHRLTAETTHLTAIHLGKRNLQTPGYRRIGLIAHLALYENSGLTSLNIMVFGIYIYTGCLQITVKRQRLIHIIGDVELHVLGQSAVI